MSRIPLPTEPFVPRFGLSDAHLQTLVGALLPREDHLPEPKRLLIGVEKGVKILCECHWQPDPRRTPTVVLVHGLEGSSCSQYIIGTGNKCWMAGLNVVRMNMRSCGSNEQLAHTLYHSGMSGDVDAVVSKLVNGHRRQCIALVGFSMGGNLVLKLAGEWGRKAPRAVRAVAAVCPAADLAATSKAGHLPQNRLYEWSFLRGLKQRLCRKARLFPGRYDTAKLDALQSMRDFDHHVTARYCGFKDAEDYYARCSAARFLHRIALRTLVIHSQDDPLIRLLPETRARLEANPNITYLETKRGGHCAFLANPNGHDGRWAELQIMEFLKSTV